MNRTAIAVAPPDAQAALQHLIETGLLDDRRRISRTQYVVKLPVTEPPREFPFDFEIVEQRGIVPRDYTTPIAEIRARIEEELPGIDLAELPETWEKIGDILILRFPSSVAQKHRAAEIYAEVLSCRAVLEEIGGISGVMRRPQVKHLWGDKNTRTVHIENSISYSLNPQHVMFSSGNVDERIRMASVASTGEVIVDLFAGIGYFTLPLAVHGNAKIYACEINPTAAQYLRDSAVLNNVASHIDVLQGDCREVAPQGSAERVIMGYLKAASFLSTAMESLRPAGGILHYHCTCSKENFSDEPLKDVQQAANQVGWRVKLLQQRIVKSYAPGIVHGVLDVAIAKKTERFE